MTDIALFEPECSGNIGAVARVMKNFGFRNLVLVNQKAQLDDEAYARAKHASDVLKRAKAVKRLGKYRMVVGTTAKIGTDYNVNRSPILPSDLPRKLPANSAILFGREGSGLTNEELQACDVIVSIPAASKYPTLNISHAVAIVLYELSKASHKRLEPASKKDIEVLFSMIDKAVELSGKAHIHKTIWKRVIGKSSLTKREAFYLIGFFRQLGKG